MINKLIQALFETYNPSFASREKAITPDDIE